MKKHLTLPRLGLLLMVAVLAAACTSAQQTWPGIIKTDNNEIYVSFDSFIAKLDANGDRIWTYPEKDDRERSVKFFAPVTADEEVLYVGDYTGGVHAINSETGERIWLEKIEPTKLFGFINFGGSTDRVIAPIAVGEDVIYVPDENGIFLLDKATGKHVDTWEFETERAIWSQPIYLPATEDQPARLFVGVLDQHLYCLNAEDGSIIWDTDVEGAIPSQPTLDQANNILFVSTFKAELIAVDAADGTILDRFEAEDWLWDAPALYEGTLYFGDLDGYLYALTFTDGEFQQVWKRQVEKDSKVRATPLISDNMLVVGTYQGNIYGLDRTTGDEVWRKDVEEEVHVLSSLVLIEAEIDGEQQTLVIAGTDKPEPLLIGLRLDNGNQRWAYEHKD